MDRADSNGTGGIAGYMRVSSDVQKMQGTIENQRAALERYAAVDGVQLYGVYEDEGVSGYYVPFALRPDGKRLLADIQAGVVRTVVVTRLDRFGRNAREILNAVHVIEQAGARLISLKENVDTRTPAGRFFLTVLAGVAELERDSILERAGEGMARRLTDGGWMGGWAPYGYRVEGRKRDARLVIDDTIDEGSGYSEADAYRLAWHLLVEQDWTADQITERLVELDIPAPKGGRWQPTTVYRLLSSPTYAGEHVYHAKDGTAHVQAVPAIITREQHERALATLADHRRYARTRACGAHPYLLARMVRCNECGELYTTGWSGLSSGKGERRRYYACSTHHYRTIAAKRLRAKYDGAMADCIGRRIRAEELEAKIWGQIVTWAEKPGPLLREMAAQFQRVTVREEGARERAKRVQAGRDELQAQRDRIISLYRIGELTEADLRHQLRELTEAEGTLRADADAAAEAIHEGEEAREAIDGARDTLQRLHAELAGGQMTPARQREHVEKLIREIRVRTVVKDTDHTGRPKYGTVTRVVYRFERPEADGAEGAAISADGSIAHSAAQTW